MSGFQFPPPPPPPPKPSIGPGDNHQSQRGSHDRDRGRGRGRGSQNGRGRGDRGGHTQHRNRQHPSQGYSNSSTTQTYGSANLIGSGSSTWTPPSSSPSFPHTGIPPGSYVNPAFLTRSVQPSSFLPHSANPLHDVQSHPSSTAGHKRKLEQRRGPQQDKRRPGPSTAPSVPSFGASLVANPQNHEVARSRHSPGNKPSKRASNIFGLTPQGEDPQYTSSDSDGDDDDGVDEEALYAELGTTLTFEHNGTVTSLNTAADLSAWKDERRKHWPTKHRMAVKADEKRRVGEQRRRLMADAISKLLPARQLGRPEVTVRKDAPNNGVLGNLPDGATAKVKQGGDTEAQHGSVDRAQEKSGPNAESEGSNAAQPQTSPESGSLKHSSVGSEGIGANGKQDQGSVSAAAGSESNGADHIPDLGLPPSESSDQSGESTTEDSDDDEPPEEEASRPSPLLQSHDPKVCRYFATSGRCKDGESCRFKHEVSPSMGRTLSVPLQRQAKHNPSPRSDGSASQTKTGSNKNSIYKLLVEREQDDTDLLALKVIRQLGDSGFFAAPEHDSGAARNLNLESR